MAKSPSRNKKLQEQQQEPKAAPEPVVDQKGSSKPSMENKHMSSIIEYTEDLANAEAPVPLPAGDYPAEIRAAERKTSAKGNDYINVTFFISADAYPADFTEGDPDGQILSYGRLSPDNTTRARYGMKKFAESIGAPASKNIDLNDWVGLTALVTVAHDEYEGETRAQIKKVNPA